MLRRVKRPSVSWKPPIARYVVGRIRNRRANRKNGTTPTHAQEMPSSADTAAAAGFRPSAGAIGSPSAVTPLPPRTQGRGGRPTLTLVAADIRAGGELRAPPPAPPSGWLPG